MSTEAGTSPAQAPAQITSAEQLIAAREARGWSMSDVAAKLGMMPRQIDAIEHGRWESLPGQAFVRGAIRAYGKAVQADVAPLLATLGAQTNAPELRPSASLEAPLPRHGALGFDNGGSGSRLIWILLGILGVVAIAMYFGRGADFARVLEPSSGEAPGRAVDVVPLTPGGASPGGAAPGTTAPDATAPGTPTPGTPAPGSGAAPAGGATTEDGAAEASASPVSSASAPDAGQAAGAASFASALVTVPPGAEGDPAARADTGSTTAAVAAGSDAQPASDPAAVAQRPAAQADSLVLRFERESWVEVRDGTGRVLLIGTQPAQSLREISGQKPYSMTIGNAPFVRVEAGGRNVDLGAVTQKGVARVRIE